MVAVGVGVDVGVGGAMGRSTDEFSVVSMRETSSITTAFSGCMFSPSTWRSIDEAARVAV